MGGNWPRELPLENVDLWLDPQTERFFVENLRNRLPPSAYLPRILRVESVERKENIFLLISLLPFDTKLLLTKNYSEKIVLLKLRISGVIPWKSLSFLEIRIAQNSSKIAKDNSQSVIFVIISCQRVGENAPRVSCRWPISFLAVKHVAKFSGTNLMPTVLLERIDRNMPAHSMPDCQHAIRLIAAAGRGTLGWWKGKSYESARSTA